MKRLMGFWGLILTTLLATGTDSVRAQTSSHPNELPRRGVIDRVQAEAWDREISQTIQTPGRVLRFEHTWYQHWPSRWVEQWLLGKRFNVYTLEFAALDGGGSVSVLRVQCDVTDWPESEYLLIEKCEPRPNPGRRALTRAEIAAFPDALERILKPNHYWMVMYEELGL
jgi:hypothetical protein